LQTIILAGGLGTRLSEETVSKPKPMVEIGDQPILWHIMKSYARFGYENFLIALGYKGEVIKDYFLNYRNRRNSVFIRLTTGEIRPLEERAEDWNVGLIDTGLTTETGGRVRRMREFVEGTFMMTYGDGLANIDIAELVAYHKSHGKLATVTATRPAARFGGLRCNGGRVTEFREKVQLDEGWINGGYFVLEKEVLDYIGGDDVVFEREPMEALAKEGQLMAYRHHGFWQPMDTLREVKVLNQMWDGGTAPWKVW